MCAQPLHRHYRSRAVPFSPHAADGRQSGQHVTDRRTPLQRRLSVKLPSTNSTSDTPLAFRLVLCEGRVLGCYSVLVMSLHKLTVGDGYTYLTRQVAAVDSTERGSSSLGQYYTEKGESPGQWMGSGLDGLASVAEDSGVSEAQMKALFGEGRHPDADAITQALIAEGKRPATALAATRLGVPFKVFEGATEFRTVVAQRFVAHNVALGVKGNTVIAEDVRAGIRTRSGSNCSARSTGGRRLMSGSCPGSSPADPGRPRPRSPGTT